MKFRIRKIEKEDPGNLEELAKLQAELKELEKLAGKSSDDSATTAEETPPTATKEERKEPVPERKDDGAAARVSVLRASVAAREAQIADVKRHIAAKEREAQFLQQEIAQSRGEEFVAARLKQINALLDQIKADQETSFETVLSGTSDIMKNELIEISSQLQTYPKEDSKQRASLDAEVKEKSAKVTALTNQIVDEIVTDKLRAIELLKDLETASGAKERAQSECTALLRITTEMAARARANAEKLAAEKEVLDRAADAERARLEQEAREERERQEQARREAEALERALAIEAEKRAAEERAAVEREREERIAASKLAAEKAAKERKETERRAAEALRLERERANPSPSPTQPLEVGQGFKMCPNCNTKNEATDKYCFKCSRYIPTGAQKRAQPTDTEPECQVCFTKLLPDATTCAECGEPVVKSDLETSPIPLDGAVADPGIITSRTCAQCFTRSPMGATHCVECSHPFKTPVPLETPKACLICFTVNALSICHECGYEFLSKEEEELNCPDCYALFPPNETVCPDCGYDKNAVKKSAETGPRDLPELNMKESIAKRKVEAEAEREAILVAARERYNMIRANEKIRSLEPSLAEQKELALAKRKQEEEDAKRKKDALLQIEIDAANNLKETIAKRKAEAAVKKQKEEEEWKLRREKQQEETKRAEDELKRQRALVAEKAREDRAKAEAAKKQWEIEKKEIERRTMIEKAKQDKLNNQRIREERERVAMLNTLLSPRSKHPLPEQKNYYLCPCGFQNIDYVKFCENCGNCQPQSPAPQQESAPQPLASPFTKPLQLPQVQCTMFCGFLNDLGKKFCESCGAGVAPHVQCNVNGCTKWNDATRNFCEACGAKIVQASTASASNLVTCSCGVQNDPATMRFCEHCGTPVQAASLPASQSKPVSVGEQVEQESVLVCDACKHQNEGTRKFCEECGAKICPQVTCLSCSHVNDIDRLFCGGCGANLKEQKLEAKHAAQSASTEQQPQELLQQEELPENAVVAIEVLPELVTLVLEDHVPAPTDAAPVATEEASLADPVPSQPSESQSEAAVVAEVEFQPQSHSEEIPPELDAAPIPSPSPNPTPIPVAEQPEPVIESVSEPVIESVPEPVIESVPEPVPVPIAAVVETTPSATAKVCSFCDEPNEATRMFCHECGTKL